MPQRSAGAYLIVNDRSAWPIRHKWMAQCYLTGVYSWPGCTVKQVLEDGWELTDAGNFVRKEIQND